MADSLAAAGVCCGSPGPLAICALHKETGISASIPSAPRQARGAKDPNGTRLIKSFDMIGNLEEFAGVEAAPSGEFFLAMLRHFRHIAVCGNSVSLGKNYLVRCTHHAKLEFEGYQLHTQVKRGLMCNLLHTDFPQGGSLLTL